MTTYTVIFVSIFIVILVSTKYNNEDQSRAKRKGRRGVQGAVSSGKGQRKPHGKCAKKVRE
eukprot:5721764-Pleurochrysis_carterae.AAC.1